MPVMNDFGDLGTPTNINSVDTPASAPADSKPSPLSASSIQQSEIEALAMMLIASIPMLKPPEMNGNGNSAGNGSIAGVAAAAGLQTAQKEHEIINKMWDAYIANLREIAERLRKDDLRRETEDADKPGPKSSAEYFTYLMSISATRREDEVDGVDGLAQQFGNSYNQWFASIDPSNNSNNSNGLYPDPSFLVGSLIANPDAIRLAIGADSGLLGVYLSSSPVADALFAVGPTSGLPGDYQAAAAMVAALLNGGAVSKAAAETVANQSGRPQYDLTFATNYAKNIMAIVTKNLGGTDQADPRREGQNNMVRLMLSAMALNMVYRAAYGGMQGKEFADLLAGKMGDIPSELQGLVGQLASLVNFYLPKDAAARAETIARLMEYVDSKDPVDSMLETSNLFSSFLKTDEVDANRLASGKN